MASKWIDPDWTGNNWQQPVLNRNFRSQWRTLIEHQNRLSFQADAARLDSCGAAEWLILDLLRKDVYIRSIDYAKAALSY